LEVITAIIMSGFPIFLITFGLFAWAYKTGAISPEIDAVDKFNADLADLEEMSSGKEKNKKNGNMVMDKWVEFGGGYYGIMALVTFFHVELYDVKDMVTDLANVTNQGSLISTLISFFISFAVESFSNFLVAFTWWNYWGSTLPIENGMIWLIVTYAAYLIGEWLARKMMIKS